MATWQDEFIRLSELHRHEVERWLEGTRNANLVIDAGESEKAKCRTESCGPSLTLTHDDATVQRVSDFIGTDWQCY
jgi:hypothetical protein